MVEFSVRIDFYRDLEGPKDYVGSALRDGLSAVVLPQGSGVLVVVRCCLDGWLAVVSRSRPVRRVWV